MKTFYGVMTEIYDNDSAEAFPLYCTQEQKPIDTLEQRRGVTTYKDWYETRQAAKLALARRNETIKQMA